MALSKITNGGITGMSVSSTDVTVSSGDLLFGTAAKGVCLGVTSNTDSNAIDDYEEGTWTPTFAASDTSNNPTITYSHQTGKYVKLGALVHIDVYIRTTAVTGTTGGTSPHRLRMEGLPFQADSQGSASSSFSNLDGMSNGAQIQVSNGSSKCVIKELDGDVNNNDMFTNDLGTGSDDNQLFFSLTYRTDS